MRTHKNKIYNCKVKDYFGTIIHDIDYYTLQEIALELGLSKDIIYNINSRKGNYNTIYKNFIFQPTIEISKIEYNG
tara:strand:+ start:1031 stop:1258 length:228 start_codon:yes stop_codon:yes gene_type:complete